MPAARRRRSAARHLVRRYQAAARVAAHAAGYAGELGGDETALRSYIASELAGVGIDATRARIEVDPARVGWRQPIRVTIHSDERIDLPFIFSTVVTTNATAVARGEVQR